MDKRQHLRRWSLRGSLAAVSVYIADVLVGKAGAAQGLLSDGFLPRTAEVLTLFLAVVLLLVAAEFSKTNTIQGRDHV